MTFPLPESGPKLPHRISLVTQAVGILKDNITTGFWTSQLPGEHELCEHLHVSRVTLLNEVNGLTRIDFVQRSLGEITGGSDTNLLGPSGLLNLNCLPALGTNPPALAFIALTSNTYTIQYRDSLAIGAWLRLADIAGPTTSTVVQVPLSGTTGCRFYRLLSPQLP